jgi:hypothetical protein
MKYNLRNICLLANRLVKGGIGRRDAFLRAWRSAKQGLTEKVAGVTYGNHQKLLAYLDNCQKEKISVSLYRDSANPFDDHAVAVIADVAGYGKCRVGYLPRNSAVIVADLMDKGVSFASWLQGIVGGYNGQFYGMRIRIQV